MISSRMVANILGLDLYSDILAMLPDSFFDLADESQEKIWKAILHEALRGERDTLMLTRIGAQAILLAE